MVALTVWFDQEPGDDFREADPPYTVGTAEEVNRLLDRVVAEVDGPVPSMIEVSTSDSDDNPTMVIELGLGRERGFIQYWSREHGSLESVGDRSATGQALYDYMGNTNEIDARVEIPAGDVRRWLHELVTTGALPTSVRLFTPSHPPTVPA